VTDPVTDAVERLSAEVADEANHGCHLPATCMACDLRTVLDALAEARARPCPHVATDDEGTSYCVLAESVVAAKEVDRLQGLIDAYAVASLAIVIDPPFPEVRRRYVAAQRALLAAARTEEARP
jgi:hypothetical protein